MLLMFSITQLNLENFDQHKSYSDTFYVCVGGRWYSLSPMYKMELSEIDTSCVVQSVDIIWCDKIPGVQSTN
jgi:hypothetical protein